MRNLHNGCPDFGTPGASGTAEMSSDGLFYATCHRHYEQPPNYRHRNCQWTLPSATVTAIPGMPTELAAAVTSGDLPTVNALFKRRDGLDGNGNNKKKQLQCWYHGKFGDESRCCSGPPCPRYRSDLPNGRTTESGNANGIR